MAESFTYYPGEGDPDVVEFRGMTFKKGEAVKVEDPAAIAKLKNNLTFMKPSDRPAAKGAVVDPVVQERAVRLQEDLEDAKNDADKDKPAKAKK
jgi:hypothetical protein